MASGAQASGAISSMPIPGHPTHKEFSCSCTVFIPVANPPLVAVNLKEFSTLDILMGSRFETIMFLAIYNY